MEISDGKKRKRKKKEANLCFEFYTNDDPHVLSVLIAVVMVTPNQSSQYH